MCLKIKHNSKRIQMESITSKPVAEEEIKTNQRQEKRITTSKKKNTLTR